MSQQPSAMRTAALQDIDRALSHRPTASDAAGGVKQERSMIFLACIERWAPPGSAYLRQARQLAADRNLQVSAHLFEGIACALRADIDSGSLQTFAELVHADVFTDLLGHAAALNDGSYMLAAAVVAGAALEEHLRQLAQRHGVATHDARGPRTASALNADLYAQATAYSKAEQAQVDAWQKCRNMAAHGDPAFPQSFSMADIRRLIEGIREFIQRHPA